MNIDTGEAAADVASRLAESMHEVVNAETIAQLQGLTTTFANALGESPEAWRGALGAIGFIGNLIDELPTDLDDARAQVATAHALFVLICTHPCAQVALRGSS